MNCIFCNAELYSDSVYVTDDEMCVCSMCASRHSLYEVAIYCANNNVPSNVFLHRPSVIDYGLNVQTDEADEPGLNVQTDDRAKTEEELAHDIDNMSHEDFFSKYADNPDALRAYVCANSEPSDAFLNV